MQRIRIFHLIAFFLCFGVFNSLELNIANKGIKFSKLDGTCKKNKDRKISVNFSGVRTEGSHLYINATTTVLEDVGQNLMLSVSCQKCKTRENPDSCQNVLDFTVRDFCRSVETNSGLWGPVVDMYEPKWKCPLKKGVYSLKNGNWNIKPIVVMPLEGWYWRSKSSFVDEDTGKVVMCIEAEAKIVKIK